MNFTLQYRADIDGPALLPALPNAAGEIVVAGGTVYPEPQVPLTVQLNQPLRTEEIERLSRGLSLLLFLGRISYEDVFGAEHETRVCWRYDPDVHELRSYGGTEFNLRT
jgi:hypothetical protein